MTPNSNGFYEYLPQGYDPNGTQTYPVLIFMHGLGELGDGSTAQLPLVLRNGPPKLINQGTFPTSFTVNGVSWKFIVISPQFRNWPTPGDVNGVISYITQHYKANLGKIYLTGLSMGGGTTWDYPGTSTLFGNRIAALVPIAGASWPEISRARNIAAANLPVWATHNDGDPTVPVYYTNDYITEINTAPAPNPLARKTIFSSTSHDAWSTTYNPAYRENNMNVYEWMLQYQRTFSSNQAPIPDAGPDMNVSLTQTSVQLTGSNSWDYEGPITSYNWRYISGPAQYTISNSNIANPVLTNLVAGSYTFRLTVTDNQGLSSTDDIVIKVVPVQQIPGRIQAEDFFAMNGISTETTADAGGGLNISYIDNGDWIDYNVNVSTAGIYTTNFRVAAPAAGSQFLVKAQNGTVLATVNVPQTGNWQTWTSISVPITLPAGAQILRVYSNTSGWNFNWMEFQNGSGNQPPTVSAGTAQIITLPVSVATLTGTASDPDGSIAGYAWTQTSGTAATISNPASAITGITGLTTSGIRTFRLTVTDNLGATAYADVNVTVNAAASVKTIPGRIEAESYDAMSGIQTETTSDAGGGLNVGWIENGDWMDYNVNVTTAGNYTAAFRLATPNSGAQFQLRKQDGSILATVNVPQTNGWQVWTTVNFPVTLPAGTQILRIVSTATSGWNINWADFSTTTTVNLPPVVNAGTAQIITLPVSTVTLTGTASDPDGSIATYAWTQVSGTAATISNPASASTGITGLTTAGIRTFRLTVTDNLGATAYSDVIITVNAAVTTGKPIPGRIEAESYDAMSGIQTETTSDAGGGLNVGWIENGDWMDYNVNVSAAGNYNAAFRLATPNIGAQFQLRKQDGSILATVNVPQTGGWQVWTTVNIPVTLPAGAQTLRIVSTATSGWNINWVDFSTTTTVNLPPTVNAGSAQTITLPATVATLTGTASDPDGSIATYAWTQINGTAATISNPASASTGISGLTTTGIRTFRLTVTDNLGATAYADVTVTVNAAVATGKTIPGRIEAESYNVMSGIQTESTADAGGGLDVGWIDNGDWMDYNVNVTTAGTYTVNFRVSSPYAGQQFLLKSGTTVLLTVTIPQTGGWQNWVSVSANVTLPPGAQTLRIYSTTSGWNFNWMDYATASVASVLNGNNVNRPVFAQEASVTAYPNPVTDQLHLAVNAPLESNVNGKLFNQSGILIKEYRMAAPRGSSVQTISTRNLLAGIYYLKLQIGNWSEVIRIVKQ